MESIEDKLRKAEKDLRYYKNIIAQMPGHVYWKDKNGVSLGCNIKQAQSAGFDAPDDMIGITHAEMPWGMQADYLHDIDLQVMKSGQTNTIEERFELPDGTKKIFLSKKLPLYDEDNQYS